MCEITTAMAAIALSPLSPGRYIVFEDLGYLTVGGAASNSFMSLKPKVSEKPANVGNFIGYFPHKHG
jgi:hypothetical protein